MPVTCPTCRIQLFNSSHPDEDTDEVYEESDISADDEEASVSEGDFSTASSEDHGLETFGLPVTRVHGAYMLNNVLATSLSGYMSVFFNHYWDSLASRPELTAPNTDASQPCLVEINILSAFLIYKANTLLFENAAAYREDHRLAGDLAILIRGIFDVLSTMDGKRFASPDALHAQLAGKLCRELRNRSETFAVFTTAQGALLDALPADMNLPQQHLWYLLHHVVVQAEQIREFVDTVHRE